jgi:hypothetical protein
MNERCPGMQMMTILKEWKDVGRRLQVFSFAPEVWEKSELDGEFWERQQHVQTR